MDQRPSAHQDHGKAVAGMFGRIAGWYDLLNRGLSLGQDIYWRYRLVRHIRAIAGPDIRPPLVLDLAAGTLDVSLEILRQHPGARVLAMDFSLPMLRQGQSKLARRRTADILPVLADGRVLPLPDNSVDAVTIAFGIRNILPRAEAYAEVLRVLRPGGRFLVLEFGSGRERIWGGVYNLYLEHLLPAVGRVVSKDSHAYTYLAETIAAFPSARELTQELCQAGFSRVFYQPLLSGIVYMHVAEKAAARQEASRDPVLEKARAETLVEASAEAAVARPAEELAESPLEVQAEVPAEPLTEVPVEAGDKPATAPRKAAKGGKGKSKDAAGSRKKPAKGAKASTPGPRKRGAGRG